MITVGDFIREIRLKRGFSMQVLGQKANISSAYISEIENKRKKHPPTQETLADIAKALELDEEETDTMLRIAAYERLPAILRKEMMEKDKLIQELSKGIEFQNKYENENVLPVYGRVTAGTGGLVFQEAVDYIYIPEKLNKNKNLSAFKIKGDSMYPKIEDGSYILVKESINLNNGDIGVFVIDGEWFVKVYRKLGNFVILSSINTAYKDIEVNLDTDVFFKSIGKVVMIQSFI